MKKIILFTTDWMEIEKEQDNFLFDKTRLIKVENTRHLDLFFGADTKEVSLHQLVIDGHKEGVFVHKSLRTKTQYQDFLIALGRDVLANIRIAAIEKIEDIDFIVHRTEVAVQEEMAISVENHITKAVTKNLGLANVNINFTAYAHEGNHLIHSFLCRMSTYLDTAKGKNDFATYFHQEIKNLRELFNEKWTENSLKKPIESYEAFKPIFYSVDKKSGNFPGEFSTENTKGYPIKIVAVPVGFLSVYDKSINGKDFFERFTATFFNKELLQGRDEPPAPIIVVSDFDITKVSDLQAKGIYLDPRYRFIDSSIWCRYVQYDADKTVFKARLEKVLNTIKEAYYFNLYNKNICKEFIEYHVRVLNNSWLESSFGDGHADKITPQRFHSETFMEKKANEIRKELCQYGAKWNLLMIDDYAEVPLKEKNEKIEKYKSQSKSAIVKKWIKYDIPLDEKCMMASMKIATTLDEGMAILNDERKEVIYDIILLDYLFSYGKEDNNYEYGVRLLEEIEKGTVVKSKSVLQNYWIFPISAFPEAMMSDFQEKSIQHLEQDWQLARGADPINTPHLFRCSLFEFMRAQLKKVYFTENEVFEFLLKHAINTTDDEEWAAQTFRKFIERFSRIDGISNKSALAQTVKKQMGKTNIAEHLRRLLFFMAYSTGYNGVLLQQEFEAIYKIFQKAKIQPLEKRERIHQNLENIAQVVYNTSNRYF